MTATEKPSQYTGELSAAQFADGMNAARRNARRLANDAKLLLEAGRYPTAVSLAALSIEEAGKISILRHMALAPDEGARRRVWKDYRSHRSKSPAWILPELAVNGAKHLDDLRLAAEPSGAHTAILDTLKQLGFYTDCYGNAHWSEPQKVIDEAQARSLVRTADLLAQDRVVTVKEVELWVEHMRPVYGKPLEWMKTALLNWYAAMTEHGLWTDNPAMPVKDFVRGSQTSEKD